MNITILYWIVLTIMFIGVIGVIMPKLSGSSIILAAILIWSIATGFIKVGLPLILIFLVLILSAGLEYLTFYWRLHKADASKWSIYGAIAGMAVGFFGLLPALALGLPLIGILFGAIMGAFLGEYFYRSDLETELRIRQALTVSLTVVFASNIENILEASLAILSVVIFIVNTWPPVGII